VQPALNAGVNLYLKISMVGAIDPKTITYCPAGVAKVRDLDLKFVGQQFALPFIYSAAICSNI